MTGNELAETINKQIAYYKLLSGQTKERADLKRGEIWKFKYEYGDSGILPSNVFVLLSIMGHHPQEGL